MDDAERKRQRWLKVIVIGLGLLILVAMGIMVAAILTRHPTPSMPEKVGLVSHNVIAAGGLSLEQTFGDVRFALPKGAKLEEMKIEGGRIFLRLSLPSGASQLLVVSVASGQKLGSIELDPQ